ncbi:MAG: MMPL family transporter [Aeromicrobium sp.]
MNRKMANVVCGRRTKYAVVAFWAVAIVILGGFGAKLTEVEDNQAVSWLPGSAESTKALDAQMGFQSPDTLPAVIIYQRDGGLTDADKAKAAADLKTFQALDGTTADGTPVRIDGEIVGPIASADGEAMQIYVPLNLGKDGWEAAPPIVDEMRATAGSVEGLTTHVTGPAGNAADSAEAFAGIDSTLLIAAMSVVIIILLVTYRSPTLWFLPVFSAAVALFSAQGVIYLLAKNAGLTVNAQSSSILTVLVFGAGTDYALLLVARYREELRRHHDRHEAMAEALHRAGPAIFASAGTVILGMTCLVAAEMNSTQGLGPVAAIGVAVGVLAMLTLLPALLVIVGRWIFWPAKPAEGTSDPSASGIWARVGNRIATRPRAVWIGTSLALGAMALGAFSLNANGLTTAQGFRGTPDSIKGDTLVQKHFESDVGNPVAIFTTPAKSAEVTAAVKSTDGISDVGEPVTQGDTSYITASLTGPPIGEAAFATIDRVRDSVHAVDAEGLVGGNTAIAKDIQAASAHDNRVVIPLVLAVVLLILAVLLRAIVAPVILLLTVVLSFGAALGVSAVIFENVFNQPASDTALPLFVFVFLVALGIDYNIFLMTRVREEALKVGTRKGALIGLSATGGVITSAGFVLAATFAVLATLPLTFVTQMGFAVAFGVLLDTIVVRSVLVTALNLDLEEKMWWPSHLSRNGPAKPAPAHAVQAQTDVPVN